MINSETRKETRFLAYVTQPQFWGFVKRDLGCLFHKRAGMPTLFCVSDIVVINGLFGRRKKKTFYR